MDVSSREFAPIMIQMAKVAYEDLSSADRKSVDAMTQHLDGWQGDHSKDSVAASVFSYALFFFQKSLFHSYIDDSEKRLAIMDNKNF